MSSSVLSNRLGKIRELRYERPNLLKMRFSVLQTYGASLLDRDAPFGPVAPAPLPALFR